MPPLSLHLSIALEASSSLRRPLAAEEMGSYLFGSTLPDIHIIGRLSRPSTHFADLSHEPAEDGIAQFHQAHPELSPQAALDPATRALVAGYFSHLVTDKVWIQDIYRPFFGAGSPLGADPLSNIMDRALQYELDRRERMNRPRLSQMCSLLPAASGPLKASFSFLDATIVQQWHQFVMTALAREPAWSNFPNYAHRFLLPYGKVSQAQLEVFLADLPRKLEWILNLVTEARLAAFRQQAVRLSVEAAAEYIP